MNKNILYLGLVSFFTDFATALINPILPIFVVYYLHEGVDKVGIIVAIATLVSYLFRLLSGYIADRFGIVKPLVVAGYTLSAISKPLIGFAQSYKSVASLKALERFGKALRSAPKDALISNFSKKEQMGRTFGFHKTLDIAGEFSGTLTLFLLLLFFTQTEEHIRNIFFFTAIPGVLGIAILILFVEDAPKKPLQKEFKLSQEDKKVIKELLFYFLFLFFYLSDSFFTLKAKADGIGLEFIPLLFLLSTGVQTLTSYYSGILIDRLTSQKVLLLSYIFGIASLGFLFFNVWIAFLFMGLFTVFSLNANRAYIATFAQNKASVYGVFYAGIALFGSAGALIIGVIWEHLGMDKALSFALLGSSFIAFFYGVFRCCK